MIGRKTVLAVVAARGGSKGLPNKNVLDFDGKPLIHWTIRAGLEAKGVDRVVVSTDAPSITAAALSAGAEVPFVRPAPLASDEALAAQVLEHCLDWIKENEGKIYDLVLMLQPTTPLRTARHVEQALSLYEEKAVCGDESLVSVVQAPDKSAWLLKPTPDGFVRFCFADDQKGVSRRRQELPRFYYPNGAIYLSPTATVSEHGFYSEKTIPYVMDEESSVDIDTRADFERALAIKKGS